MATLSPEPCFVCRGIAPNNPASLPEKHVKSILKGDRQLPTCRRCQARNIECVRSAKKPVFRSGLINNSNTTFSDNQPWVGIDTSKLQFVGEDEAATAQAHPICPPESHGNNNIQRRPSIPNLGLMRSRETLPNTEDNELDAESTTPSKRRRLTDTNRGSGPRSVLVEYAFAASSPSVTHESLDSSSQMQVSLAPPGAFNLSSTSGRTDASLDTPGSGITSTPGQASLSFSQDMTLPIPPLEMQEACLLRHFIVELAHWFDLCDEARHFQIVVPLRARSSPPLLFAICAVSSRHLTKHPKFRTAKGIMYENMLLPHLTSYSAVEYMLQCIPHLFEFHKCQDVDHRANLIAAAVVLRQYEELDEEMETDIEMQRNDGNIGVQQHASFLAITQAIIQSSASTPSLPNKTLENAAFWGAATQEIYNAFTRKRPFQMKFPPDVAEHASAANKFVMHAAHVTKWCWGDKTEIEWHRLKGEQQHLEIEHSHKFVPLLRQEPDYAKEEVFPTIWYNSHAQMTAIQHLDLAKMVLVAENPRLGEVTGAKVRAAQRKAESQVRIILKNLCGIALSHVRCQPALVPAIMAISLYGCFFTDEKERAALLSVLTRTEHEYAWPTKRICRALQEEWAHADGLS